MGRPRPGMVAGRQTLTRIRPINQIVDAPFHVAGHAKGQRDQEAKDEDLRTDCGGHPFKNREKKALLRVSNGRVGHIGQHISLECGA